MELQLGLALIPNTIKQFDLNSSGYDRKDVFGSDTHHEQDDYFTSKKRSFDEAFERDDDFLAIDVPQTLPLFDKHTNKDLDDQENSFPINKSDGDENGVIGWPPIKSCRKKLCHHKYGGAGGGSKSLYVKVKMEGVAIARKVDLSLQNSYETLTQTLLGMFDKRQEEDMKAAYKLTYQDKEGDWLLAGDLPWGTFKRSVQRLKLVIKKA